MSGRMSLYSEPRWGSKILGEATVRQDNHGSLFINEVRVTNVQVVDLYSLLECDDGATRIVLTAFLRLIQSGKAVHGESQ